MAVIVTGSPSTQPLRALGSMRASFIIDRRVTFLEPSVSLAIKLGGESISYPAHLVKPNCRNNCNHSRWCIGPARQGRRQKLDRRKSFRPDPFRAVRLPKLE